MSVPATRTPLSKVCSLNCFVDGARSLNDARAGKSNLPPEIRKNIEKIAIDSRGGAVPQLYSKLAASQELRKMLNIGRNDERNDAVSRLSDAELIAQLSDTAKELGIKIDLNYSFAQQPPTKQPKRPSKISNKKPRNLHPNL
jgi:hypothetical protein